YKGKDGKEFMQYTGSFELPLGGGEKAPRVSLGAYRFDKNDPQREKFKNVLFYYRDYGWDGNITLGGATYRAMVSDDMASGDFRGKGAGGVGDAAGLASIRILIDVNGDGKFSQRGEGFEIGK